MSRSVAAPAVTAFACELLEHCESDRLPFANWPAESVLHLATHVPALAPAARRVIEAMGLEIGGSWGSLPFGDLLGMVEAWFAIATLAETRP